VTDLVSRMGTDESVDALSDEEGAPARRVAGRASRGSDGDEEEAADPDELAASVARAASGHGRRGFDGA